MTTIHMNGEHDHWFEFEGNRYHYGSRAEAIAALASLAKYRRRLDRLELAEMTA